MKSNSWTMLFLQRQERAAKVQSRRKGAYNSIMWGWK